MCERRRRAEKGTYCKNNANWICRNKGYFCFFYKVIKQNKMKPVVTKFNLFWAKLPVSSCACHIQATSPFSNTRHSPFMQQENQPRLCTAFHKVWGVAHYQAWSPTEEFHHEQQRIQRKNNPLDHRKHTSPSIFLVPLTLINHAMTSLLQYPNQTRPFLIALPLNCFCSKSAAGQRSVS